MEIWRLFLFDSPFSIAHNVMRLPSCLAPPTPLPPRPSPPSEIGNNGRDKSWEVNKVY